MTTHGPLNRSPDQKRPSRFWSMPTTHLGWFVVALAAVLAVWGPLLVRAHSWLSEHFHSRVAGQLTSGRTLVAATILVGATILAMGFLAVIRRGERSLLVLVPLSAAGVVTLFWVAFGVGEVVAPH